MVNADQLQRLTQDILHVVAELQPQKQEQEQKLQLVGRIQKIVVQLWPDYRPKLHLFGSSANNLCLKDGDLDLCLTIDKRAGTKKRLVNRLAAALKQRGMKEVIPLSRARVPIVKFFDPRSHFSCDICINNVLALHNTKLIADYSAIDPRCRQLAYIIKYWAKQRKLNEPYSGTLSSYAWVLLVINYLQQRKPPILPCLQQMSSDELKPEVIVRGFNCYYHDISQLHDFGVVNSESLGELLIDFFKFYAYGFDYDTQVVSVRMGSTITKRSKKWEKPPTNVRENHWFSIEDPFELTHDLGRVVDNTTLSTIRWELEKAYQLLISTADLSRVCTKYKPQ